MIFLHVGKYDRSEIGDSCDVGYLVSDKLHVMRALLTLSSRMVGASSMPLGAHRAFAAGESIRRHKLDSHMLEL